MFWGIFPQGWARTALGSLRARMACCLIAVGYGRLVVLVERCAEIYIHFHTTAGEQVFSYFLALFTVLGGQHCSRGPHGWAALRSSPTSSHRTLPALRDFAQGCCATMGRAESGRACRERPWLRTESAQSSCWGEGSSFRPTRFWRGDGVLSELRHFSRGEGDGAGACDVLFRGILFNRPGSSRAAS